MVRIEIVSLTEINIFLWDILLLRTMWKNIFKGLTKTVALHVIFFITKIYMKSNTC